MPTPATVRLSSALQELLAVVRSAAGAETWLVGGALRDLLDQREPWDLDFATHAETRAVAETLAERLGGSAFALDEVRRTWRVTLPNGEVVTEIDISSIDGEIEADLRRRDFTINAIAAEVRLNGELAGLIDTTGGIDDLKARRLHMVSAANLIDDPLRLLRAVRIATESGYEIEPETAAAIRDQAASISRTAAERQRDELLRIFETPRSAQAMRLMDGLGLLDAIFPELAPSRGCDQPPNHHYYDVFDHLIETLASLDVMLAREEENVVAPRRQQASASWFASLFARDEATRPSWFVPSFRHVLDEFDIEDYLEERTGGVSNRALIKLSGLLHDVSKPETKTVEPGGKVRFLGHPELGAVKAASICRRLRLGNRETAYIEKLVEEHLRPFQLSNTGLPSPRAIYRFFRDCGDAATGVLLLSLADGSAAAGPRLRPERWRARVEYIGYVMQGGLTQQEVVHETPRLVTGADLMRALDLPAGPEIGRLLAIVAEAQATGEIETREQAIEVAKAERAKTSPPAAASPSPSTDEGAEIRTDGDENLRMWRTDSAHWNRLKPRVQEMRREQTPAEAKLWSLLRGKQLGVQFRRQHPIDRFVVDFYCSPARFIVEVDGPIHERTQEADAERQSAIEALDYEFLRFTNAQVLEDTNRTIATIRSAVTQRLEKRGKL